MADLVSVTLDNLPSDLVGFCVLYAASQGKSVSEISIDNSLRQMVDGGIQAAAAKLAANPSRIPASVSAELTTAKAISDALTRIRDAGSDLSDVVAAVS